MITWTFSKFPWKSDFLCVCFSSLLRNHWNNIHLSSLHSSASLAFAEHATFWSASAPVSDGRHRISWVRGVSTWLHICPGPAVCSSEIKQLRPSSKRCWITITNKTENWQHLSMTLTTLTVWLSGQSSLPGSNLDRWFLFQLKAAITRNHLAFISTEMNSYVSNSWAQCTLRIVSTVDAS